MSTELPDIDAVRIDNQQLRERCAYLERQLAAKEPAVGAVPDPDARRYQRLRQEAPSLLNILTDGWNFFGDAGAQLDSWCDTCPVCGGRGLWNPRATGDPQDEVDCPECAERAAVPASVAPSIREALANRLRAMAEEMWPFAQAVSNIGKPESDNNFGRACGLMLEAATALAAAPLVEPAGWKLGLQAFLKHLLKQPAFGLAPNDPIVAQHRKNLERWIGLLAVPPAQEK